MINVSNCSDSFISEHEKVEENVKSKTKIFECRFLISSSYRFRWLSPFQIKSMSLSRRVWHFLWPNFTLTLPDPLQGAGSRAEEQNGHFLPQEQRGKTWQPAFCFSISFYSSTSWPTLPLRHMQTLWNRKESVTKVELSQTYKTWQGNGGKWVSHFLSGRILPLWGHFKICDVFHRRS